MQFLKNLFGGGQPNKESIFVYIRPKMCKQVLRLEIHLTRELSQTDDLNGYWVRKVANATRCPFECEILLTFDKNRNVIDREITDGEFVTEDDYQAFITTQNA